MRKIEVSKYQITVFAFAVLGFILMSFPAQAEDFITGRYNIIPNGGPPPVIVRELICADPNCDQVIKDRPVIVSRSGGSVWAGGEVNIPDGRSCRFTLDVYLGFECRLIPLLNFTTDPISESGIVVLEVDPALAPINGNFSGRVRNDCDASTTPCINVTIID